MKLDFVSSLAQALFKNRDYEKKCSCGRTHLNIPQEAKPWFDDGLLLGWMWNCKCNSTLFVKSEINKVF